MVSPPAANPPPPLACGVRTFWPGLIKRSPAFRSLANDAEDVAATANQGEVGNGDVVAYVDDRIQPGRSGRR